MKNKKYLIIGLTITAIIIYFSIKLFIDNSEKDLDDIISYNSSEFKSMNFKLQGYDTWSTYEEEYAEELIGFLSQYKVKKIRKSEWRDVSKEIGYDVSFFTDDKRIMALIYEERILLLSSYGYDGYYKVVNGPIDMGWIQKYNDEFQ